MYSNFRKKTGQSHLQRYTFIVLILVVVVTLVGCAEVNRLREAQDAFDQAARAENHESIG